MKFKTKKSRAAATRSLPARLPTSSQLMQQYAMQQFAQQMPMIRQPGQMVSRLTLTEEGVPYSPFVVTGANHPFFGPCQNELMSLHYGGRFGLLDLFNWTVSDAWVKSFKYITFVRPEMAGGNPTPGWLADPCADPNSFEYGTTDFTVQGFGRYGRKGPVREILTPTRYCETDPRRRLDGTLVTSEFEWDLAFATDVLSQDLFRDIIIGNSSTPGKFNGLQQIINTGYGSGFLNSMVIEWANNGIDGQGGGTKTLNGEPIPATANLINVLLEIFRRYRQRIRWSPQLANQTLNTDDVVLVLPTHLATCVLDAFTCWSVCAGGEFNPVNLQTYEARQFRNSLNGGRWGAGRITLDGVTINLFPYDWETMHGTNSGDMYFLTLRVGTQNIWEGEHLDAAAAAAQMQGEGHGEYFSTDGGRIIGVTEADNLCRITKIWIRPRLICRAPWLQTRIMNVSCASILPPLGPDPLQTSFYPETSFVGQMATIS